MNQNELTGHDHQDEIELDTERIGQLADHMDRIADKSPENYNQKVWGVDLAERLIARKSRRGLPEVDWTSNECGTTACLAGWAVTLLGEPEDFRHYEMIHTREFMILEYAQDLLGLTSLESTCLFAGMPYKDREPTPKEVASVVRHLAQTENVDWRAGRPGEPNTIISKPVHGNTVIPVQEP